MAITLAILSAVLMALVVAGILVGIGLRHKPPEHRVFAADAWLNTALVLGFLAGYARILEAPLPAFPPVDATHWLYFAVATAWLPMLLLAQQRRTPALALFLPLLALLPVLLAWPLLSQPAFPWPLVLSTVLINLGLPHFLDRALPKQAASAPAFAFASISGTLALQLGLFARSGLLSELALILGALQGLVWLLSLRYQLNLTRGYHLWTALITTALGLAGALYANLTWEAVPLLGALAVPLLSSLPAVQRQTPRWRAGLIISLTLGLCLGAVGLGVALHPDSLSGSAF